MGLLLAGRSLATCLGGVVGCVCMFVCTELCGRPSVGTLCVRCVLC